MHPSSAFLGAAARAKVIRSRVEKFKEWGGGHSPFPVRAVNANTFAKVRRETTVADAPALLLLLLDEGSDIRWMAARLLKCVDPNAEQKIEAMLNEETNNERRSRLYDSLTAIRVTAAGGALCKIE